MLLFLYIFSCVLTLVAAAVTGFFIVYAKDSNSPYAALEMEKRFWMWTGIILVCLILTYLLPLWLLFYGETNWLH